MNKFLLLAINSKYIHSNPAVYSLKAVSPHPEKIKILEYTVNSRIDDIIDGIYEEHPDAIGISCYIWNIDYVKKLLPETAGLLPGVPVWLGGPEVSYNPEPYLREYDNVEGIICGEGEIPFNMLTDCCFSDRRQDIRKIPGMAYIEEGRLVCNPCTEPLEPDLLPPPVIAENRNRIMYYESSRGCPFSCSYCLSSIDKKLRFRSCDKVKTDLKIFLDAGVPLVKFVDRTFNCNREHSRTIWKYIIENDNGITGFHFEISADLLEDEDIAILNGMRPGLVQLEIGVQSVNEKTLRAIHRNVKLDVLMENVRKILAEGNIHVHLDLIAGLPYEDMKSFRKSFNEIYLLHPHALQLGFLKLLYGTRMRNEAGRYGMVCRSYAPYEVLYTDYMSYDDMRQLKKVENVLDMYYNSRMYPGSIKYLQEFFESPYDMYVQLGEFYNARYHDGSLPSRTDRYRLLYDFAAERLGENETGIMAELLKYDMLLRDNAKNMPDFMRPNPAGKRLTKAEHAEVFSLNVAEYVKSGKIVPEATTVYFNYLNREKTDNNATVKIMEETE